MNHISIAGHIVASFSCHFSYWLAVEFEMLERLTIAMKHGGTATTSCDKSFDNSGGFDTRGGFPLHISAPPRL